MAQDEELPELASVGTGAFHPGVLRCNGKVLAESGLHNRDVHGCGGDHDLCDDPPWLEEEKQGWDAPHITDVWAGIRRRPVRDPDISKVRFSSKPIFYAVNPRFQ
jgi:hypothetical protein